MGPVGAVDLGATNLRVAVGNDTGALLAVDRRHTPADRSGSAVVRAVAEGLASVTAEIGQQPADLEAVGIGTIGPLDRDAGAVVDPPNLPGVGRIELKPAVVDLVGHERVYVENDAVAALVGERQAAVDPPSNLVYLTLSTGIGAGVAVDDHVLRGRRGNAAEVGHFVVDPSGARTCGCGRPGHWEAYASGAAIPAFARDVADATDRSTSLELADPTFDAAAVFEAAEADPLADHVIDRVASFNAIGVANLLHAFAPDRLAIGGTVALENQARVIDPLESDVAEHTMLAVPPIEPAAYGSDAVLRGALALATAGGLDG